MLWHHHLSRDGTRQRSLCKAAWKQGQAALKHTQSTQDSPGHHRALPEARADFLIQNASGGAGVALTMTA